MGRYKGYFFRRARVCDVLCVNIRSYAYHAWAPSELVEDDDGYIGHFPTMKAMYSCIDGIATS